MSKIFDDLDLTKGIYQIQSKSIFYNSKSVGSQTANHYQKKFQFKTFPGYFQTTYNFIHHKSFAFPRIEAYKWFPR